jgi:hypothetical protein
MIRRCLSYIKNDVNKTLKVRGLIFECNTIFNHFVFVEKVLTENLKKTAIYDTSKEIYNISTVKTKYYDKIVSKIGSGNPVLSSNSKILSDAELLTKTKFKSVDSFVHSKLVLEEMSDFLCYASDRSIRLILVIYSQNDLILAERLVKQQSGIKFDHIINLTIDDTRKHLKENLKEMEKVCGIEPSRLLLISPNEDTLLIGKENGYLTCRYK